MLLALWHNNTIFILFEMSKTHYCEGQNCSDNFIEEVKVDTPALH